MQASREYSEPSVSCLLFLLRQLEGRGVTVMRLNIRWRWCSPAFQHQPRQGILNASTYCSSGSFSKRFAMNIYRCTSNCTFTSKIWKIWVYFQGEYIIFYFQGESIITMLKNTHNILVKSSRDNINVVQCPKQFCEWQLIFLTDWFWWILLFQAMKKFWNL